MKRQRLLTLFVAVQIYCVTLTSLAILYTGYAKWWHKVNDINLRRQEIETSTSAVVPRTSNMTTSETDNRQRNNFVVVEPLDHDGWIHIGKEVHLYSAHWDNRSDIAMGASVRVLGIVPATIRDSNVGILCMLWYKDQSKAMRTIADIEYLQEHHEKPLRAAFIVCATPSGRRQPPYAVSLQVISQKRRLAVGPPNPLPVRLISSLGRNATDRIAVCVKPVRQIISSTLTIAEFIAFYKTVGVTKFIFFSTGLTADVWEFLKTLAGRLKLEIDLLPWNLYKRSDDVYDNARIISINHCIYRYMTRYEFMAIVDLDEFMAPKRPDISLQKLLRFTERRSRFPTSSFSFVNRFYCLEYGPASPGESPIPLVTRKYTRMCKAKWPSGYLSKYIARPDLIIEAGEYRVWRRLSNTQIFTIKPYFAYLHHYAKCRGFVRASLVCNQSKEFSFMVNFTQRILGSDVIGMWKETSKRRGAPR